LPGGGSKIFLKDRLDYLGPLPSHERANAFVLAGDDTELVGAIASFAGDDAFGLRGRHRNSGEER